MPFLEKGVFLLFVCAYFVNICQYWSTLINIRYCVRTDQCLQRDRSSVAVAQGDAVVPGRPQKGLVGVGDACAGARGEWGREHLNGTLYLVHIYTL